MEWGGGANSGERMACARALRQEQHVRGSRGRRMPLPGRGVLLTCALEGNEGKVRAGVVPSRDLGPFI